VTLCCSPSILSFVSSKDAISFRSGFGSTKINYKKSSFICINPIVKSKHLFIKENEVDQIKNNNPRWLFIIGIAIGTALVTWITIPRLTPHTFHGTLLQSPVEAPDFTL
jgi:hypothetical protein